MTIAVENLCDLGVLIVYPLIDMGEIDHQAIGTVSLGKIRWNDQCLGKTFLINLGMSPQSHLEDTRSLRHHILHPFGRKCQLKCRQLY